MNLFLTATALVLCSLHSTEAVGVIELENFYNQFPSEAWKQLLKLDAATSGGGRSGDSNLNEFFNEKCKPPVTGVQTFGEFCFIVQTSCLESKERRKDVLKSVKNDILDILQKADKPTFSLVTYSQDATTVLEWAHDPAKLEEELNKIIEAECDSCKAATYKAVDRCKELFENKQNNSDPDNIVTFTNGVSVEDNVCDPESARGKTIGSALSIQQLGTINLQVVKIPPGPLFNDELDMLSYKVSNADSTVKSVSLSNLGVDDDQTIEIALRESDSQDDTESEKCCTADVVFILDKSDSIDPDNVQIMLDFMVNFLEIVKDRILDPANPNQSEKLQIAVYTYAGKVTRHARLGQFGANKLISTVKGISSSTSLYTSTHLALKLARSEFERSKRRQNKDVRKIVVLMTDGRTFMVGQKRASNGKVTKTEAAKLKAEGVEVYIGGLPNKHGKNDGYEREWKDMASEPKNCTIINLQKDGATFDALDHVWKHLTEEICLNKKDDKCRWHE